MKWNKYTIETTTAAEDYMSAMLADLGIEGVEIEDNIPLSKEDQADMFIDFLPELPPDDGVSPPPKEKIRLFCQISEYVLSYQIAMCKCKRKSDTEMENLYEVE